MIEVVRNPEHSGFDIVELKSNLSISLDRLAAIFLGLSAVTLLVAVGPMILGLWPVMVIAVLHLLAVGLCLRLAWRGHWARQRLQIGPGVLRVDHDTQAGRQSSEWPLAWVKVVVERGRLGDARVFLSCHGKRQEVGGFLSVDERLEAAQEIKKRIGPMSAWTHDNQPQVSLG